MGLFRKEEKVHFVRDDAGKVVEVQRSGDVGTPVSDRLLAKQDRKSQRLERRREYRKAYDEARHEAKLKRMKQAGSHAGSTSMSDRFNNVAGSIQTRPYSTHRNSNPFGSMFDTGMKHPKTRKKSSSKKYTIVGGKAYPIAGTGKKKKKGKRKTSSRRNDPFDFSGYGGW